MKLTRSPRALKLLFLCLFACKKFAKKPFTYIATTNNKSVFIACKHVINPVRI